MVSRRPPARSVCVVCQGCHGRQTDAAIWRWVWRRGLSAGAEYRSVHSEWCLDSYQRLSLWFKWHTSSARCQDSVQWGVLRFRRGVASLAWDWRLPQSRARLGSRQRGDLQGRLAMYAAYESPRQPARRLSWVPSDQWTVRHTPVGGLSFLGECASLLLRLRWPDIASSLKMLSARTIATDASNGPRELSEHSRPVSCNNWLL